MVAGDYEWWMIAAWVSIIMKSLWIDTKTLHWTIRNKTRPSWKVKKAMSQCRRLDLHRNKSPACAKSYNRLETWNVSGGFFGRCRNARKFSWTSRCWKRGPSWLFIGMEVCHQVGLESTPGISDPSVKTEAFRFFKNWNLSSKLIKLSLSQVHEGVESRTAVFHVQMS